MVQFLYLQTLSLRRNDRVPIKKYTNWNKRSSNSDEQIDPFKRYYFICEGKNTERWYFEKLIDIKKSLSIHSSIEVAYLEKTDEHENISNPKSLIDFGNKQIANRKIEFDPKYDKLVIIFDADIFESQQSNYDEIITSKESYNLFGITNPSFELFLLLHIPNSLEEIILPNMSDIVKNSWVGKSKRSRKRYIADLFFKITGIDTKKSKRVANFAKDIFIAIAQETRLNRDINNCKGVLTSNIGSIVKSIIDDQGNENL